MKRPTMSQILMILFCIIMGEWLIFSVIKTVKGRGGDLSHGCFQGICLREPAPADVLDKIKEGLSSSQCKDLTKELNKPRLTAANRLSFWQCSNWSMGDWSAPQFELLILDGNVAQMNAFAVPLTGQWTEAEFMNELEEKYRQKKYGSYLRVQPGYLQNFRKKLLMKVQLRCDASKACAKTVRMTWQEADRLMKREEGWLEERPNKDRATDLP